MKHSSCCDEGHEEVQSFILPIHDAGNSSVEFPNSVPFSVHSMNSRAHTFPVQCRCRCGGSLDELWLKLKIKQPVIDVRAFLVLYDT